MIGAAVRLKSYRTEVRSSPEVGASEVERQKPASLLPGGQEPDVRLEPKKTWSHSSSMQIFFVTRLLNS